MVPRVRALSILEAIISLFLLTAAVLVLSVNFNRVIQLQRSSSQRRQATVVMRTALADLRSYRDGYATSTLSWADYWTGYPRRDVQSDGFRVQVTTAVQSLVSPCRGLELVYGPQARTLANTSLQADLLVSWSGGGQHIDCTTLLTPPPLQVASVNLQRTDGTTPIDKNTFASFEASAVDAQNRDIEGACIAWSIDPDASAGAPGLATRDPLFARNGRDAHIYNLIYRPDSPLPTFAPGSVRITAHCRVDGVRRSKKTTLELLP